MLYAVRWSAVPGPVADPAAGLLLSKENRVPHCHGALAEVFQGKCGSAKTHDEHDFTEAERVCMGSPFAFIAASCGNVGPHEEHPLNESPVMTEETDD
jgi:hypothetical protein